MSAVNWVLIPALALVWLLLELNDHKPARRTAEQVRVDVARRRADRLTRQTLEDTETCKAIWKLTEIPSQRKETGQ